MLAYGMKIKRRPVTSETITQSHSQITKNKSQNIKEKLEAKYQRVTDSKSKIKSVVSRTIPQDSRDRLMVDYNFIRWQTNLR